MTRPVFGVDFLPEPWARGMGEYPFKRNKDGSQRTNPMLVYGPGPEDKRCGDCAHLFRVGGVAGRYYKCDLRRQSASAVTDHRVRWPTCSRFEEADPQDRL